MALVAVLVGSVVHAGELAQTQDLQIPTPPWLGPFVFGFVEGVLDENGTDFAECVATRHDVLPAMERVVQDLISQSSENVTQDVVKVVQLINSSAFSCQPAWADATILKRCCDGPRDVLTQIEKNVQGDLDHYIAMELEEAFKVVISHGVDMGGHHFGNALHRMLLGSKTTTTTTTTSTTMVIPTRRRAPPRRRAPIRRRIAPTRRRAPIRRRRRRAPLRRRAPIRRRYVSRRRAPRYLEERSYGNSECYGTFTDNFEYFDECYIHESEEKRFKLDWCDSEYVHYHFYPLWCTSCDCAGSTAYKWPLYSCSEYYRTVYWCYDDYNAGKASQPRQNFTSASHKEVNQTCFAPIAFRPGQADVDSMTVI